MFKGNKHTPKSLNIFKQWPHQDGSLPTAIPGESFSPASKWGKAVSEKWSDSLFSVVWCKYYAPGGSFIKWASLTSLVEVIPSWEPQLLVSSPLKGSSGSVSDHWATLPPPAPVVTVLCFKWVKWTGHPFLRTLSLPAATTSMCATHHTHINWLNFRHILEFNLTHLTLLKLLFFGLRISKVPEKSTCILNKY